MSKPPTGAEGSMTFHCQSCGVDLHEDHTHLHRCDLRVIRAHLEKKVEELDEAVGLLVRCMSSERASSVQAAVFAFFKKMGVTREWIKTNRVSSQPALVRVLRCKVCGQKWSEWGPQPEIPALANGSVSLKDPPVPYVARPCCEPTTENLEEIPEEKEDKDASPEGR